LKNLNTTTHKEQIITDKKFKLTIMHVEQIVGHEKKLINHIYRKQIFADEKFNLLIITLLI
jgi:hypothetical protein